MKKGDCVSIPFLKNENIFQKDVTNPLKKLCIRVKGPWKGGIAMDDQDILALYLARREEAVSESEAKYGRYLHAVAYNILYDHEDAKECVNDTYVGAWNSIPPNKPAVLRTFLAKITRNSAINRYHQRKAEKRMGEVEKAIEEYYECLPSGEMPTEDAVVLKMLIDSFLSSLQADARIVFLQRYWYFLSVKEIARARGMSESAVKTGLMRTRNKFKEYLAKEGVKV